MLDRPDQSQPVPPDEDVRLRILHARVPGRLRVDIPVLKQRPDQAHRLEAALASEPGLYAARLTPATGHLLVEFDPAMALADMVRLVRETVAAVRLPVISGGAPDGDASVLPGRAGGGNSWHTLSLEETAARFGIDPARGPTPDDIARLVAEFGDNRIEEVPPRSDFAIMGDQFKSLPVGLLLGSAVVSVATGGLVDAIAILCVVGINAAIGFVTESQSERTIDALSRVGQPDARVRRDGAVIQIPAAEVVPGDVLLLAPGTVVTADARLIDATELTVDESVLTGESIPVTKVPELVLSADTPLGDRVNMIHRGASITGGSGTALVVATGADTESGRIASLVGATRPPETPLQVQLDRMSRQLVMISSGAFVVVFGLGLLRGRGLLQMLKTSISLAVAALPEGLPTVGTVTLAFGIRTMRQHQVLVRRLDALETLGAVNVICFDKTGTLTENRIRARTGTTLDREVPATEALREEWRDDTALQEMLRVGVLCNETRIAGEAGDWQLTGSPTESALVQLAIDMGIDPAGLRRTLPVYHKDHRTERRRYMATRHDDGSAGGLLAVKGSPAEVLAMCGTALTDGGEVPLDETLRQSIIAGNEALAQRGLRVLGFAAGTGALNGDGTELRWLGMVGMSDPARSGMDQLIGRFHDAGIKTVMITGDQAATAQAIASDLGLAQGDSIQILEGGDLARLEPEVLAGLVKHTDVFARVSPSHKLHIVRAYQAGGMVVAMTGDGINDSPALRASDIGVAMGGGSQAAHQVSEVILADDELDTMAQAIGHGRTIYGNIRKALHFLLATNFSEILVTMIGNGAGPGDPLTPMQLLWINIITDVFPALGLALEPPEADVMQQPPRPGDEAILRPQDFRRMGVESGFMTAAALASYFYGLRRFGPTGASGMTFTTLTVSQLLHAISSRSQSHSIFGRGRLAPNPSLRWALGGLIGVQALASVLPGSRRFLGLTGMGPMDFAVASLLSSGSFLAIEALKRGEEQPVIEGPVLDVPVEETADAA